MKLHLAFEFLIIFSMSSAEGRSHVFFPQIDTGCKPRTLNEPTLLPLLGGPLMVSTFSAHRVC